MAIGVATAKEIHKKVLITKKPRDKSQGFLGIEHRFKAAPLRWGVALQQSSLSSRHRTNVRISRN